MSCQDSSSLEVPQLHSAEVVAGTGNVDPAIVNKVRKLVAVELPQLQEVFDGKQVQRFFVYVHASRESMPEHLVAGVHEDAPGFAILGRHQIHLHNTSVTSAFPSSTPAWSSHVCSCDKASASTCLKLLT